MALDDFVDEFYLDHPDKTAQQRRLDVIPYSVANPLIDAWITDQAIRRVLETAGGRIHR